MLYHRIGRLPETYTHPRHWWVLDLPELECQTWLARFRYAQKGPGAYLAQTLAESEAADVRSLSSSRATRLPWHERQ